jgi:hypothetical protein
MVEKFRELGYDFVFVTDHEYFTTPPDVKGILTLGAEEVGTYDSGYYSHGNAFDIHETIRGDRVYIPEDRDTAKMLFPRLIPKRKRLPYGRMFSAVPVSMPWTHATGRAASCRSTTRPTTASTQPFSTH